MSNKKGKSANKFRNISINHNSNISQRKNLYIKISLLIVFLIAIVSGISYAFYTLTISSSKNIEVVAGTFNVEFKEGNVINLANAIPMSDIEGLANDDNVYSFSISNSGTIDAKYNLNLEETSINANTIDKKYIKYSLKENDGEWSNPQLLSTGLSLRNSRLLAASKKVSYQLKLWVIEDAGNEVQGKEFSAKVVVSAVQNNSQLVNTTYPIINIANTSINVYQNDEFNDPEPYEIKDANGTDISMDKLEKTYEYFDGNDTITVSSVDTSKIGIYYIYYKVSDSDGNIGCTVVSVNVCSNET